MSAHLQHLMHAGGSRHLVPPDPAGADGTLLVPPQGPTLRLKITGFENYGLALGKIASRIFRAG